MNKDTLVAIIDADLADSSKVQRFPNLACMKLSAWYKEQGYQVKLIYKYDKKELKKYDIIHISKVFTWSKVPDWVLESEKTSIGGTGFFSEKAPFLDDEIEHIFPDYNLYDEWYDEKIESGIKPAKLKYYKEYSVGFTTRGCKRKCPFCVNRRFDKAFLHSKPNEFVDKARPYIALLDDNILAFNGWKKVFRTLALTGKKIEYKQGYDLRDLNPSKAKFISGIKRTTMNVTFAFDNLNNRKIIEDKLKVWRANTKIATRMYILSGFDFTSKYEDSFWIEDLETVFKRMIICREYKVGTYVCKFEKFEESPFVGIYKAIANWSNHQSGFVYKISLEQFCIYQGMSASKRDKYLLCPDKYVEDGHKKGGTWIALDNLKNLEPEFYEKYATKNLADLHEEHYGTF